MEIFPRHRLDIDEDTEKVFIVYQRAMIHGFPDDYFFLGQTFHGYYGREPDLPKAIHWYELAMERGHAGAHYAMGCLYYHGMDLPTDYEKAFRLFQYAAYFNMPMAHFYLQTMYHHGLGVEKNDYLAQKHHENGTGLEAKRLERQKRR